MTTDQTCLYDRVARLRAYRDRMEELLYQTSPRTGAEAYVLEQLRQSELELSSLAHDRA